MTSSMTSRTSSQCANWASASASSRSVRPVGLRSSGGGDQLAAALQRASESPIRSRAACRFSRLFA